MSTEANKEIVRRWFDEVIGLRKIDLIDEICAADVVNYAAVPERRYCIEGMKDVARFIYAVQPLAARSRTAPWRLGTTRLTGRSAGPRRTGALRHVSPIRQANLSGRASSSRERCTGGRG